MLNIFGFSMTKISGFMTLQILRSRVYTFYDLMLYKIAILKNPDPEILNTVNTEIVINENPEGTRIPDTAVMSRRLDVLAMMVVAVVATVAIAIAQHEH